MDAKKLQDAFNEGMNYAEYRQIIDQLMSEGKTTGADQSQGMLDYTALNIKRMDRGDKTVKISEESVDFLKDIPTENWLVITEAWCGDASQIVPTLAKIEAATSNINMRMIWRDENLEIMDAFLTNGTRSIPKLIRLNEDFTEVLGEWGPRPEAMHQMVLDWKEKQDMTKTEMYQKVHGAYAKDRGKETVREIMSALESTYSAQA